MGNPVFYNGELKRKHHNVLKLIVLFVLVLNVLTTPHRQASQIEFFNSAFPFHLSLFKHTNIGISKLYIYIKHSDFHFYNWF